MNKGEIKSLTGIRGVAASFVMFHHWAYFLLTSSILSPFIRHRLSIFFFHGNWNVDLFFILSGFLLSITSYNEFKNNITITSYSNFIIKRFCRVYPIYISLTLFYLIVEILFTNNKTTIPTLLVNITLFQNILDIKNINPLSWSLSVEWVIYFLLPLLFIISNKVKSSTRIFALYTLSLLIMGIITKLFAYKFYQNISFKEIFSAQKYVSDFTNGQYSFLRGISSYLLGIASFTLLKKGYLNRLSNPVFYIIFITQFILLFINSSLANILFILLIPFSLINLTRNNSLLSKFLSTRFIYFLGEISFSLYLIHYVFVMSVSPRLEIFLMNHHVPHYKYLIFFSLLIIIIVLSALLYYYLEKPLNNWLRNRLLFKHSYTDPVIRA